jgi:hypothetical protein
VAPIDEARAVAAGRLALVRSLPVVQRAEEMPPGFGVDAPGPVWLLAVADGHQPTRAIAFLARPISLRFTSSEVARVHALTAIARALAPRAPVTPPAPPASSAPTPAPAG